MSLASRIVATFIAIVLIATACDEPIMKEWATSEAHPRRENLSGAYYQGDGLGMNVTLYLSPDGSFYQSWYGCRGLYGEAAGGWSLQDSVVRLKFQFRNGALADFPETLLVMHFHDTLAFLAGSGRYSETYREFGADKTTLLRKLSGDTSRPMSALADLDGDRVGDLIVGANNDTSYSLRVYVSAMSDSGETDSLVFRHWKDGCHDCLCSGSGAFRIETMYSLDSLLDPTPPGYVIDSSCAQIEVYSVSGECDGLHCYWDRKRHKLLWWSL